MSIKRTTCVVRWWSFPVCTNNFVQYIVVHRVQPTTQKGYLLVAHTAFHKGSKDRGFSTSSLRMLYCALLMLINSFQSTR